MGGYAPGGSSGGGGGNTSPLAGGSSFSQYYQIDLVPSGSENTIFQYTTPPGKTFVLVRIDLTGNNIAEYKLYFDGVQQSRELVWFGQGLTSLGWDYSVPYLGGLWILPGTIISTTVTHNRPAAGSFSSTLHGILV